MGPTGSERMSVAGQPASGPRLPTSWVPGTCQRRPSPVPSMSSFYLVLVGPLDSPLSQHSFSTARPASVVSTAGSSGAGSSPAAYAGQLASSFPSWASSAPQAANPANTSVGGNLASMAGARKPIGPGGAAGGYDEGHLKQMAAHSSLDMVEDAMVGGSMSVPSSFVLGFLIRRKLNWCSSSRLLQVSQGGRPVQRMDDLGVRRALWCVGRTL